MQYRRKQGKHQLKNETCWGIVIHLSASAMCASHVSFARVSAVFHAHRFRFCVFLLRWHCETSCQTSAESRMSKSNVKSFLPSDTPQNYSSWEVPMTWTEQAEELSRHATPAQPFQNAVTRCQENEKWLSNCEESATWPWTWLVMIFSRMQVFHILRRYVLRKSVNFPF